MHPADALNRFLPARPVEVPPSEDPSAQVLVTAHPRSGTHYTGRVLRRLRHRVSCEGHWRCRQTQFVVSWKHAQEGEFAYRHRRMRLYQGFRRIIHQVRHPLDVIASSATLHDLSIDHMRQFLDLPEPTNHRAQPLTLCMRTWLGWNALIEARAHWRFRLEDVEDIGDDLCRWLGIPVQSLPALPPANTRRRATLQWDDLERADRDLAQAVREMARRYGYTD